MSNPSTRVECCTPILWVSEMKRAVDFYVNVLGFTAAEWGNEFFTSVNRDKTGIYLCLKGQGQPGAWVWVGVEDAGAFYEYVKSRGGSPRHAPRNYWWALEFHVADPDGNVLRIGSEPKEDAPHDDWMD